MPGALSVLLTRISSVRMPCVTVWHRRSVSWQIETLSARSEELNRGHTLSHITCLHGAVVVDEVRPDYHRCADRRTSKRRFPPRSLYTSWPVSRLTFL